MARRIHLSLLTMLFVLAPWIRALGADPSAPSYSVKIEFGTRVKMRDGVELSVDLYRPDAEGRFPVILSRTPYNKSTPRGGNLELGRYFAARGYVYVAMDVRGRGDSDGTFTPYRNE